MLDQFGESNGFRISVKTTKKENFYQKYLWYRKKLYFCRAIRKRKSWKDKITDW